MLENCIMKVQIEVRIIGDLALNHIIPTAIIYQNKLIQNANGLKGLDINAEDIIEIIQDLSNHINMIKKLTNEMVEERKKVNKMEDSITRAIAYCDQVKTKYFDQIRYSVDKLELLVDDEDWPLVKYRELLFCVNFQGLE